MAGALSSKHRDFEVSATVEAMRSAMAVVYQIGKEALRSLGRNNRLLLGRRLVKLVAEAAGLVHEAENWWMVLLNG